MKFLFVTIVMGMTCVDGDLPKYEKVVVKDKETCTQMEKAFKDEGDGQGTRFVLKAECEPLVEGVEL